MHDDGAAVGADLGAHEPHEADERLRLLGRPEVRPRDVVKVLHLPNLVALRQVMMQRVCDVTSTGNVV